MNSTPFLVFAIFYKCWQFSFVATKINAHLKKKVFYKFWKFSVGPKKCLLKMTWKRVKKKISSFDNFLSVSKDHFLSKTWSSGNATTSTDQILKWCLTLWSGDDASSKTVGALFYFKKRYREAPFPIPPPICPLI